ncbi:MutS family DNA mismatch repair protein [Pontixanthobacter gangjinensis]|uniref:DNA mismatch repair protein MutS n=1 Tax=Christiangramia aestuarii TaxID=1028746 RepID=A0A7K1LNH4_9FLAO|nr:DNA mismatch repair protein MutS [Christiangramia aestuarii]MUP42293.1 DNA mismatch repair protein MutS [Christiangramia aestuarii]
MTKAEEFYSSRQAKYSELKKQISRKLAFSSTLRLVVFLAICASIYFFFGNITVLLPLVIALIAVFIFLISRHTDLKKERDKLAALIDINKLELRILKTRDFSDLPDGKKFEPEDHEYARDIDLFGRKSFFQFLNRTALKEGKARLARILLANKTEDILKKQEAIKELASKADWRQNYSATATLVKTETDSKFILNWIQNYKSFVPKYMKWFPAVFSILSIAVLALFYFDIIGGSQVLLWFIIGVLISGVFLKKVNDLSGTVSKVQDTFQQYHQLLDFLETEEFESALMQEVKNSITSESKKASVILKEFSRAIDALDQRNNFLFGIFANGFFLWDLRQCYRLEKWIQHHHTAVEHWFEAVERTDAYNSLGNFSFNHESYHFPEILKKGQGTTAKNLGHPLLHPQKRINNDFRIDGEQFFIITGANMAGKSTFLRTVALQIVMANIGLPVCAESCSYAPTKLITSMRTSDSLGDDESYFFSELKRLKFIVDKIQTEDYFIILDEILKGTNSTDKAIGSRKFVQRLVGTNSTGIIATHDLSLCEISQELEQVKNFYFDAEIVNNELHFDYHLKDGVCQNMNASFLLRKMKIVED